MNIETARNNLANAIKIYMEYALKDSDEVWGEKMIAGVLAFIHVNYFKEPYLPTNLCEVVEEKHWWEFWKRS